MTKIKSVDNREGRELAYKDIEIGQYLFNTETGGLSLVADLEIPDDTFYGILDLNAKDESSHDVNYMFSTLKDLLLEGNLKGKYLPVYMQEMEITTQFSVNEYNQISKKYLPKLGDVFYHPDSDETLMLINYTTDKPQWTLVSLTTGNTLEASNSNTCALAMDAEDKDTVFNEIATFVNDRVILPVSNLEFKYTLQ